MVRDIPEFELGYVTLGSGEPADDWAVAYSEMGSIERELRLEGDGSSDLMPLIVQAVNSYDETTAALRSVRASDMWPELPEATRQLVTDALAKAEAFPA